MISINHRKALYKNGVNLLLLPVLVILKYCRLPAMPGIMMILR